MKWIQNNALNLQAGKGVRAERSCPLNIVFLRPFLQNYLIYPIKIWLLFDAISFFRMPMNLVQVSSCTNRSSVLLSTVCSTLSKVQGLFRSCYLLVKMSPKHLYNRGENVNSGLITFLLPAITDILINYKARHLCYAL